MNFRREELPQRLCGGSFSRRKFFDLNLALGSKTRFYEGGLGYHSPAPRGGVGYQARWKLRDMDSGYRGRPSRDVGAIGRDEDGSGGEEPRPILGLPVIDLVLFGAYSADALEIRLPGPEKT